MRDHPWHKVSIMAGLWAAKLYQPLIRRKMKESIRAMVEEEDVAFASRIYKVHDMFLLER